MRNLMKSRGLDKSGPAKASPGDPGGDKSLSAKQAFIFCLRNYTFQLLLATSSGLSKFDFLNDKFYILMKSYTLLKKSMFLEKHVSH